MGPVPPQAASPGGRSSCRGNGRRSPCTINTGPTANSIIGPPLVGLAGGSLFCGVVGYFLWNHAATNNRGLVINHLIELSRENATLFWWGLAWMMLAFIPMSLGLLLLQVLNPQRLALAKEGIYACKWPWSLPALIPYTSIRQISTSKTRNHSLAKILHRGGSQTIASAWMQSEESFVDFCEELNERIHAAHSAAAESQMLAGA